MPRVLIAPTTLAGIESPFIGALKHLPTDAAANIDHYLYGATKRP